MQRRAHKSLTTILALTLGFSLVGPAAQAVTGTPVTDCGTTVDGDAYLVTDLYCAGPVGVTILSGGTLDLRKHTLYGPGTAWGTTAVQFDNAAPITVTNGKIAGWGRAVGPMSDLWGSNETTTISKVRFTDASVALDAALYGQYDVTGSTFTRTTMALSSFSTAQSTITDSTLTDAAVDTVNARLILTRVRMTRGVASCTDGGLWIRESTLDQSPVFLDGYCAGSEITDSVLKNAPASAVAIYWSGSSTPMQLLRNTFVGNAVGVETWGQTHLADNEFRRNGRGVVQGDTFLEETRDLVMERNTFVGNGDGLYAEGRVYLQGTLAVRNSGWGIFAPNAVDLGGNVAYRNGNDPQCVGLVCASR